MEYTLSTARPPGVDAPVTLQEQYSLPSFFGLEELQSAAQIGLLTYR